MARFVVSGQVDGIYDRDTDTAQTLVRRPRHSLWASARPGREGGGRREMVRGSQRFPRQVQRSALLRAQSVPSAILMLE